MAKKLSKKTKRAVKKAVKKAPSWLVVTALILIIAIGAGYFVYVNYIKKPTPIEGEISFHFMMLGNGSSGDSIYIKAGENDILIDAGSKANSVPTIKQYLSDKVLDNKLEYVIVTHADLDHIAGFSASDGIFDAYKCDTIIDFPKTNKELVNKNGNPTEYSKYITKREAEKYEGANHFTALECYNESKEGAKREFELADGVSMEILYNYYYDHQTDEENDYSVCIMFKHGDRRFLFTGDLEKEGEEYLAEKYNFTQVELYKAGHHGSKSSSTVDLLKEIQPKIVVISCAIGDSYDFPRQETINRIAEYTDKVYVTTMANEKYTNGLDYTAMNGNVVVYSKDEGVEVKCSANDALLKDTDWFRENRTLPQKWAA